MKICFFLLMCTSVMAQYPVALKTAKKAPPQHQKVEHLEQKYSPEVKRFIVRCLDDEKQKFENAQAWLKLQKVEQPDRDQMWEILSGLVWNIDKPRARTLALEIKNIQKQKAVIRQYDMLEKMPQPPEQKD